MDLLLKHRDPTVCPQHYAARTHTHSLFGRRYNQSADTFSYSLVLLCLAVGDIGYLRQWARILVRETYESQ